MRYGQERVTVTNHGKPVAAIVSIDDLELLKRIEDEMDLKLIEERRNEEAVPWDEAKKHLSGRGADAKTTVSFPIDVDLFHGHPESTRMVQISNRYVY